MAWLLSLMPLLTSSACPAEVNSALAATKASAPAQPAKRPPATLAQDSTHSALTVAWITGLEPAAMQDKTRHLNGVADTSGATHAGHPACSQANTLQYHHRHVWSTQLCLPACLYWLGANVHAAGHWLQRCQGRLLPIWHPHCAGTWMLFSVCWR